MVPLSTHKKGKLIKGQKEKQYFMIKRTGHENQRVIDHRR